MKRIIIVGPAAAGKDFLKQKLENKGYKLDISYTTRPLREGEVHEKDYHFLSKEKFEAKIANGDFYEYVKHGKFYYGTGQWEWDNMEVFIMETEGIEQLFPEDRKNCLVIYLSPSEESRFNRLWSGRGWKYGEISDRFIIDKKKFEYFTDYDIKISNPDF